ncbi:MarR family winged helix-turn-helix transcriptional regulator [Ancylomarina sp.]|uniref:MarR family winged helix-turn-helix transcriptional regulator n=1 Tax=Ancylomarina sp. TaxID=1970196 RepID=UPI003562CAD5
MSKVNLEKSVNHHIAISAIMIKRVFFKILSDNEHDITPEQWNILYHLNESNGMTIGKLSELTYKDFANMSRISQKLEAAGFIEKKRDEKDKRIFKLFITKKGQKLNKQLHQCACKSTNIAIEGIDNKTRELMVNNLKQIITNTEQFLK